MSANSGSWAAVRTLYLGGVRVLLSENVRRAGIYVASALTSALIPFLLLPILARTLGPEGYGLVGAFTGLVTLATVLIGLSTQAVLTTTYFRVEQEKHRRYLASCLWLAALTAPTLWIVATLAGDQLERMTGIGSAWTWALVGAGAGQFLLSVSLAMCQVKGRALLFAGIQVANSALNLGLTMLLVFALSRGWEGRAIGQCVATLGIGLASLWLINLRQGVPVRSDRHTMVDTLKFGVMLVPHVLASAVMGSADRLILVSMIDAAAAGWYFVAFQVASVVSLTSSAINQAMAPWLFRNLSAPGEDTRVRIVRTSYLVMALLVAQGAVLALLAHPIVLFAGGPEFAEAVPLVRILAIAMTLNGIYFLFTNYIFYTHRTHLLSMLTVTVSFVQVAATLAFVHVFGIIGAAWAAVVANLLFAGGAWVIAAWLVPMPWLAFRRLVR
ncbi:MAG TPA: hypothetical protein DCY80_08385 [Solibacterales bacterium]|nr:hypothetical protein [Bryobacterales bacterium]